LGGAVRGEAVRYGAKVLCACRDALTGLGFRVTSQYDGDTDPIRRTGLADSPLGHAREPLGPEWRKAGRSMGNGACVEVCVVDGAVLVRDSKNPGPTLRFDPQAWRAFTAALS
jgi:Domain of unknown function (DUF397)